MYREQLDKNIILEKSAGTGRANISHSFRNLHTLAKNVSPQPTRIEKDKSSNKTQK